MNRVVNVIVPVHSSRCRFLGLEGWTSVHPALDRGDGYAHLTKEFDSNREIAEHLDIFADSKLTAWVTST